MKRAAILLCVTGLSSLTFAGDALAPASGTVIGPENPDLTNGAMQLRLGDAESGIKLTQRGLLSAKNLRQEYIAYSNLCAGYILVDEMRKAISYCDRALKLNERNHHALSNRALALFYLKDYEQARVDVSAGIAIAPYSGKLKRVSQMIEDVVNPVSPEITIEHDSAAKNE